MFSPGDRLSIPFKRFRRFHKSNIQRTKGTCKPYTTSLSKAQQRSMNGKECVYKLISKKSTKDQISNVLYYFIIHTKQLIRWKGSHCCWQLMQFNILLWIILLRCEILWFSTLFTHLNKSQEWNQNHKGK